MRAFLRRQPPTPPLPRRGDPVEAWLRTQRDRHVDDYGPTPEWYALDAALRLYGQHADTGTPLGEPLDVEVPW